jgi:hypothetical protein
MNKEVLAGKQEFLEVSGSFRKFINSGKQEFLEVSGSFLQEVFCRKAGVL